MPNTFVQLTLCNLQERPTWNCACTAAATAPLQKRLIAEKTESTFPINLDIYFICFKIDLMRFPHYYGVVRFTLSHIYCD